MQTKQPPFKLPLNNICIETKTHSFFNTIEYLLLDKQMCKREKKS